MQNERAWALDQMRELAKGEIGSVVYLSPRFNVDRLALEATEQLGWFKVEVVDDGEYISQCIWKTFDLL